MKEELCNLIGSSDSTFIMGTETWLNPINIIHKSFSWKLRSYPDRSESCGGVFLAIKNDNIYEKINAEGNTESVFR